MFIRSNILIFLGVLLLFPICAEAQFYITYDIGVAKYNVDIDEFGDNYYETITPALTNLGLLYQKGNSRWYVRVSTQKTRLDPVIKEIDYHDTNFVDMKYHKLEIEYLRNVKAFSSSTNLFLGLVYRANLSEYTHRIYSNNDYRAPKFREFVVFDLALLGKLEHVWMENIIHFKAGFGMFNHRLTKDYSYDENEFYGIGPNLLFQFRSTIDVQIPLSDRIFLKPEYSFNYRNFHEHEEVKTLHQYVLIGGVFRL